MDLVCRKLRGFLLAGLFFLLLGFVGPQKVLNDNREICLQPVPEDACQDMNRRWRYDRYSQTCQEFSFGGCIVNANNFKSLGECEKTCWLIKKVSPKCRLEVDEGICRATIPSYFFNLSSMACEKFNYGGCYGNDNRFDTKKSCMDYCLPIRTAPLFCYSPKDEGLCSASVSRFYYNAKTKKCEEFSYTGCGGNENNFVSVKSCNKICKKDIRKPYFIRPKPPIENDISKD